MPKPILPLLLALSPHQERPLVDGGMARPAPLPIPASREATVYGYHPYWSGSPNEVDLAPLSHIAVFSVELQADGSLSSQERWTETAESLVDRAHSMDVKVHLCMTSFSDEVNEEVLSSPPKRAAAIGSLAGLVSAYGADGVNVDIEGLESGLREEMVDFVQELAEAVDEVVVAMPAVDWSGSWDYQALAAASDGLFIMGYGYHWSGGDPGPVDPLYGGMPWGSYALDWTVEDYLSEGVDPGKVILGLPLYGREWPTSGSSIPGTATGPGEAVTMSEAVVRAQEDGKLFDESSWTPYVLYSDAQLWYGDVDSVRKRIEYARSMELQGVGFWALTYEQGVAGFWEMVMEETSSEETESSEEEEGSSGNQPPVADAGDDRSAAAGAEAKLDGSYSYDPDGDPASFLWEQAAGPETGVSDPESAVAAAPLPEAGTYVFRLTVQDPTGGQDSDLVTVVALAEPKGGCSHTGTGPWLLSLLLIRRRKERECQPSSVATAAN
jgi:hypothetical protein